MHHTELCYMLTAITHRQWGRPSTRSPSKELPRAHVPGTLVGAGLTRQTKPLPSRNYILRGTDKQIKIYYST